jgi:hypothetical protein
VVGLTTFKGEKAGNSIVEYSYSAQSITFEKQCVTPKVDFSWPAPGNCIWACG